MDVLQKNKLLGLECFFRFTSREHKDSILSCYEGIQPAQQTLEVNNKNDEPEEELFKEAE
jgi:hypothetical protein